MFKKVGCRRQAGIHLNEVGQTQAYSLLITQRHTIQSCFPVARFKRTLETARLSRPHWNFMSSLEKVDRNGYGEWTDKDCQTTTEPLKAVEKAFKIIRQVHVSRWRSIGSKPSSAFTQEINGLCQQHEAKDILLCGVSCLTRSNGNCLLPGLASRFLPTTEAFLQPL